MQQVVRKLVFGMAWRISLSDERRELAQLCAEARANAYAGVDWDRQHRYGLGRLKSSAGLRSAAAVLAYLLGDQGGVFVHQIGNGACCCIAVTRHLPVEGMDRTGTRAEMLACAADYLGRADGEGLRLFGDVAGEELAGCTPLGLDRLVDSSGEIGRVQAHHRVDPRWALAAGAAAMLSLACFGGDLAAAWQPPAAVAAAPSAQLRYRDRVAAAVADVAKSGRFQADLMPAFTALADALPFAVDGWEFERLGCEDARCKAVWRRVPGGSAAAMLAALHSDGDDGSVSFPTVDTLQKELTLQWTPRARKLAYAPNAMLDPAVLDWVQALKDRGFEPRYGSPLPLVAPDPGLQPDKGTLVLAGDYAITLPYREIADLSQLPNSMTIEHIEIKVAEHQIVTILRGKYYAL